MENFVYNIFGNNWLGILIVLVLPMIFVVGYALVAILGELKISAFIQERLGPMRTGPWGIIQPVAEVFKLLQKEDITPDAANKPFFNLAPFIIFAGAYGSFAVIPFSSYFIPSGLNLGLFFLLAVGSFAVIGIVMGGWASNNKYSIMGAMRSVSQIVSYEIPAAVCILTIATLVSSYQLGDLAVTSDYIRSMGFKDLGEGYLSGLNVQHLNIAQSGWFWNWFVFGGPGSVEKLWVIPFLMLLFVTYFISSLAETNRTPFDIPEGESELVAGYHTEYTGMKFAMFFFAEYANMFVVAAVTTILFFGGWNSPFGEFLNQPYLQPLWFIGKAFVFVFIQIWLRWTLPRFRVDQLMFVGWKVLLPVSFVSFLAVSFWGMLH